MESIVEFGWGLIRILVETFLIHLKFEKKIGWGAYSYSDVVFTTCTRELMQTGKIGADREKIIPLQLSTYYSNVHVYTGTNSPLCLSISQSLNQYILIQATWPIYRKMKDRLKHTRNRNLTERQTEIEVSNWVHREKSREDADTQSHTVIAVCTKQLADKLAHTMKNKTSIKIRY